MKRLLVGLALLLVLGAVGCAGNTDPATNVTNVSAQLNAHGHTTGEPATWWWEYSTVQANLGTASDTEVCGVRHRPEGARQPLRPRHARAGRHPAQLRRHRADAEHDLLLPRLRQGPERIVGRVRHVHSFKTLAGTSYAFDRKWGGVGTANGQFQSPRGIATDSAGNVYVIDAGNDRIQKFTRSGGFITQVGDRRQR